MQQQTVWYILSITNSQITNDPLTTDGSQLTDINLQPKNYN